MEINCQMANGLCLLGRIPASLKRPLAQNAIVRHRWKSGNSVEESGQQSAILPANLNTQIRELEYELTQSSFTISRTSQRITLHIYAALFHIDLHRRTLPYGQVNEHLPAAAIANQSSKRPQRQRSGSSSSSLSFAIGFEVLSEGSFLDM